MKGSIVTPTDEMTRTLRVLAQLMNEDGVFGSETLYHAVALLDAQAAEIDRLRNLLSEKVIDSTRLREFVVRNGGLNIELEGGACALMAQAFGKQLFESGAENYIEASFESPDYPDIGQITVTVRREAGKTPHELRVIAEKQRDQLRAEVERLRKDSERYRFLREQHEDGGPDYAVVKFNQRANDWLHLDWNLDAEIDGAMAAKEGV